MSREKKSSQSAAEILRSMENLVWLQHQGLMNVRESLAAALAAFDGAPCETITDALAFISASRRLGQSILIDIARGDAADPANVDAADRYMETAVAFFRGEEMRRQHGHFGSYTLH